MKRAIRSREEPLSISLRSEIRRKRYEEIERPLVNSRVGVSCKYSLLCGTNTIRARFPLHLAPLFAISPCYINTDNLRIAPPPNAIYPRGEVEVFDIAIRLMDSPAPLMNCQSNSIHHRIVNDAFFLSFFFFSPKRFQKFLVSLEDKNIFSRKKKSFETKSKQIIFIYSKILVRWKLKEIRTK